MPLDRVVVSSEEVESIRPIHEAASERGSGHASSSQTLPAALFKRLPSPIPWWARIALSLLVLILPALCVLTLILRIAFRNQPPRVKHAWVSFLSTLLIVSGLLTTAGTVFVLSSVPIPAMVDNGLSELDERTHFPSLPSAAVLSSSDVSQNLKPLVIVVSPAAARLWNHQDVASTSFGAGMLLHADKDGYLFATANHVVAGTDRVLIATQASAWSKAELVGRAPQLDLALLWLPRQSGNAEFTQPLGTARDGSEIFVIGHPEGLRYTLSTGIVSGLREDAVQISAAVSPGNSGGPVYDNHGNLVGVVSSKFDHNRDANAENLSFAARTSGFQQDSNWTFLGHGREWLDRYVAATQKMGDASLKPPKSS